MNAVRRSAPTAFAATNECTSPSTCAGIAHVLGQQREQVLVGDACAEQLHRRDLDALLEDLARMQRVLGAADVADMADRTDETDQAAVAEHRGEHRDIEEMAGAEPRIVGDQHVARHQRLGRVLRQERLHGSRQAEIEHRHGARRVHQRLALGVEQLAGEILCFRDDQREGRADHREPHLVDHGDEPAPHDLQRDRSGLDPRHRVCERRALRRTSARGSAATPIERRKLN
jgi:hypothetical protein